MSLSSVAVGRGSLLLAALGMAALISGCETTPKPKTALIVAPSTCTDTTISLYFEPRSAVLGHAASRLLDAAAASAKACVVTSIEVKGLADAVGAPEANQALSKARADAVTQALHKRGFEAFSFEVTAVGATGSQSPLGEDKPLRRRADVVFHLTPRP